jgi:hypothetical protein
MIMVQVIAGGIGILTGVATLLVAYTFLRRYPYNANRLPVTPAGSDATRNPSPSLSQGKEAGSVTVKAGVPSPRECGIIDV